MYEYYYIILYIYIIILYIYYIILCVQIIVDLGHLDFESVSNWSEASVDHMTDLKEHVQQDTEDSFLDIDIDDDGMLDFYAAVMCLIHLPFLFLCIRRICDSTLFPSI